MYKKGFTLIELLVVIAIIGILASVILASLNTARAKARDAKRAQDMDQIYTALNLYYDTYGCLPRNVGTTCGLAAGTYVDSNAGSWDYSSQGGFLGFLVTAGLMPSVPVDPINNMTGDGTPNGTYSYRYYCYNAIDGTPHTGLHIGYYKETGGGGYVIKNNTLSNNFADNTFVCK